MYYKPEVIERVLLEAECFIAKECTVRDVAEDLSNSSYESLVKRFPNRDVKKDFSVSKSTVHEDLALKLPEINWALYMKVRKILNKNKEESASRGGKAIRKKRKQSVQGK